MNSRYQHLLVLTGSEVRISAFTHEPFSFGQILPAPADLPEVDELDHIGFHFLQGDHAEGFRIADDLSIPLPFTADTVTLSSAAAFVRNDAKCLEGAQRISSCIRKYGSTTVRAWKQRNWGGSVDAGPLPWTTRPGFAAVLFGGINSYIEGFIAVAHKHHSTLRIQAVVVDLQQLSEESFDTVMGAPLFGNTLNKHNNKESFENESAYRLMCGYYDLKGAQQ
ncbi:hypothetical protein LC612_30685 [Nostoc sp. CHAB 5834]|nr:hypothetical protein [Nostoc sp. CHAB 5834]